MVGEIIYPSIDDAIAAHATAMQVSDDVVTGAGAAFDLLKSALEHIQNDEYYPTFDAKLAHLFFSACKHHAIIDGNKRMTLALTTKFLILNEHEPVAQKFIRYMENVLICVADNKISKEFLGEIISAFLRGDEENEEIKLKILHAVDAVRQDQEERDAQNVGLGASGAQGPI